MGLVLTRKTGETIVILPTDDLSSEIVLRIESIARGQARIRFHAPRDEYQILRGELLTQLETRHAKEATTDEAR